MLRGRGDRTMPSRNRTFLTPSKLCVALTSILSSILIAGCNNPNPSEHKSPDAAASTDAPTNQGADVPASQPDSPTGGTGGGSMTGGGGSAGGAPDAPGSQPDVPMGGSAGGAGGIGGGGVTGGDAGGSMDSGGLGMPDASGVQPDVPMGGMTSSAGTTSSSRTSSTGGSANTGSESSTGGGVTGSAGATRPETRVDAGGGSGSDTPLIAGSDARGEAAGPCVGDGVVAPSLCTSNPALPSVTDLSGTWVLETIGAQTVTAPTYPNPFHLKSIGVILVQVTQTGSDVTLAGHYCDRIQNDNSVNPAKVVVPDAWRLTPFPIQRSGTFVDNGSGQLELTLPGAIEVAGANLADPACDALPTDPNDPRVVDTDHDGYPGISVSLTALIAGSLRSVQRQSTALHGVAVAADRIEGGMTYESDQSVIASDPASIKTLYQMSKSSADSAVCSSSFVMVKVSDAVAGTVDCDWVRANEAPLLGL